MPVKKIKVPEMSLQYFFLKLHFHSVIQVWDAIKSLVHQPVNRAFNCPVEDVGFSQMGKVAFTDWQKRKIQRTDANETKKKSLKFKTSLYQLQPKYKVLNIKMSWGYHK